MKFFAAPQAVFLDGTLSLYEGDDLNLTCEVMERNPFASAVRYTFRLDEAIVVLNVSDGILNTKILSEMLKDHTFYNVVYVKKN